MDLLEIVVSATRGGPQPLEALVSPTALEATNGMLVAALLLVTTGAVSNLAKIGLDVHAAPADCFTDRTKLQAAYRIGKPSMALAVGFGGMLLNVGTKWFLRWLTNHGYSPPSWAAHSSALVLLGAACAVVGLLCWLRVTMPDKVGFGAWLFMLIASFAFGTLMTLSPG